MPMPVEGRPIIDIYNTKREREKRIVFEWCNSVSKK